jgi:dolichol-phosphate mannosyltransferase
MAKTLVCSPTYNEAQNIERLVTEVLAAAPDAEMLVVDDGSPDGTGELVERRMLKEPRLYLIQRPGKLGLGTAYLAGFAYGLQHGHDRVITMDADFSHAPAAIPELVRAVEAGADLAIGSRYTAGGSIVGWGMERRLLSAGANAFARSLLGLGTRDCTGGFRCYVRSAVEYLVREPLRSSGYSALIELLARCERAGFRIREIPIAFVDRQRGQSKISRQEIIYAIGTVLRLARRRP